MEKQISQIALLIAVSLLVLSVLHIPTGVIASHSTSGGTFQLCEGPDTVHADAANQIKTLVSVFMVMGPVIGIIMHLFATLAMTAKTTGRGRRGNYSKLRKSSLIYGFSIPIVAYGFKAVDTILFGFSIGCIIPTW